MALDIQSSPFQEKELLKFTNALCGQAETNISDVFYAH